jgi:hypothetical protein
MIVVALLAKFSEHFLVSLWIKLQKILNTFAIETFHRISVILIFGRLNYFFKTPVH